MVIDIGHIDKRINSTKQTFTKLFQNKTVYLKQPTSVVTPVFILKDTENNNTHKYSEHTNYLYCPEWGYYWIDDIIYRTHDIVEFHCSRDTLATGKDYIKKINSYVKYCSDLNIATEAKEIDDDRLGPDIYMYTKQLDLSQDPVYPEVGNSIVDDYFTFAPGEGTVIVSTIVAQHGLVHWSLSTDQFDKLIKSMATGATSSSDFDDFILKFFGNDWKDCIINAKFVPIKKSAVDGALDKIGTLGAGGIVISDESQVSCTTNPNININRYITRKIPIYDAQTGQLPFLMSPKYTTISIEHMASSIDISSQAFVKEHYICIEEGLDILNGIYTQSIYYMDALNPGHDKGAALIASFSDDISIDLSFALSYMPGAHDQAIGMGISALKGVISNSVNMATGGLSAGTSISSGHLIQETYDKDHNVTSRKEDDYNRESKGPGLGRSAISSIGSGIIGAFTSANCSPSVNSVNTTNSITTMRARTSGNTWREDMIRIIASFNAPSLVIASNNRDLDVSKYDEFCELYGYPCNKFVTLGDVADNSFILCVGADAGEVQPTDIAYTLTKPELATLNNWLNTGIYLE